MTGHDNRARLHYATDAAAERAGNGSEAPGSGTPIGSGLGSGGRPDGKEAALR